MAAVKELQVNGMKRTVDAAAERSLLSVLRDDLELTGCKYGCGEGKCGACTVLVDGRPTRSCTMAVGAVEGKPVKTVESLAEKGKLHPIQEAFLEVDAMQCGYCIPGMIMSAFALLTGKPDPERDEIVRFMGGNICRCGTYTRIVAAIQKAAQAMKGAKP
jgi:aerobic-type carbon monoxide dehydrogenase small subunit (CoxS/CutS family)